MHALSSALLLSAVAASAITLPRRTNELPLSHVAVASLGAPGSMPNTKRPLIITTFYVSGSDLVTIVPDAAAFLSGASNKTVPLDADATWPNQADLAPAGAVVGNGSYVLSAGG